MDVRLRRATPDKKADTCMRKRLYEIIEAARENDRLSNVYDGFIMIVIVISLIPLAFKTEYPAFTVMENIAVAVFIVDYALRLATADYKLGRGALSFPLYPLTPMALVDLLSILPSLNVVSSAFRILKLFRLFRSLRVFRIFKAVRYSKSIRLIKSVFLSQRRPLIAVGVMALAYLLISALVIFNVEPDSFDNFFEAVYWATISLTTVGYGDIYPVSTLGRLMTMLSSVFGIAIIALPSGIITAGFMEALGKEIREEEEKS